MSFMLTRRLTLAAMLTCLGLPALAQEMKDKVRIGYAISKTGVFAGGRPQAPPCLRNVGGRDQ